MEELKVLLENVSDSYYDFCSSYVAKCKRAL